MAVRFLLFLTFVAQKKPPDESIRNDNPVDELSRMAHQQMKMLRDMANREHMQSASTEAYLQECSTALCLGFGLFLPKPSAKTSVTYNTVQHWLISDQQEDMDEVCTHLYDKTIKRIAVQNVEKYSTSEQINKVWENINPISKALNDPKTTADQRRVLQNVQEITAKALSGTFKRGENPVMLIHGGPGVGKTWTSNIIQKFLNHCGLVLVSAATTGVAATLVCDPTQHTKQFPYLCLPTPTTTTAVLRNWLH